MQCTIITVMVAEHCTFPQLSEDLAWTQGLHCSVQAWSGHRLDDFGMPFYHVSSSHGLGASLQAQAITLIKSDRPSVCDTTADGTEESYANWIRRFIVFHGKRHPADLGGPEISRVSDGARHARSRQRV